MSKKLRPIFRPMPGAIAVRLHEETRYGSLILPPSAQQSKVMGTITAVGPDEQVGEDWDLEVGDEVLFGQNAGVRVTVDGHSVLLLRTREILSRVEWEDENGVRVPRPKEVLALSGLSTAGSDAGEEFGGE